MSGIDQLLELARAYAEAEGLELSTVSWRVFGDTKKFGAIETGSDIQVRRYEKAVRWFSAHWPDRATWPSNIERPQSAEAAAS
jgi:hypothetical protein